MKPCPSERRKKRLPVKPKWRVLDRPQMSTAFNGHALVAIPASSFWATIPKKKKKCP
jgi:hypothetical protein